MNGRTKNHAQFEAMSPMMATFGNEMAMELLTRLSPTPLPAVSLRQELVIEEAELTALIWILRKMKLKVVTGRISGRESVWINRTGWKAAEAIAQAYYAANEPGNPGKPVDRVSPGSSADAGRVSPTDSNFTDGNSTDNSEPS